jgi:hypothetical protein
MSCYGWERGEVKVPVKEFSSLKKSIISAMQSRQETLFNKAINTYTQLKEEKKGKRNFPLTARLSGILWPTSNQSFSRFQSSQRSEYDHSECYQIQAALIKDNKLRKPTKKDFKLDSNQRFTADELCVSIDSKTKTIHWSVADNNRSVEAAHESFLGRTVLQLLKRINYTSKTGGYFEGNDEYNRDESSGANYVTERFGRYANPQFIMKQARLESRLRSMRY